MAYRDVDTIFRQYSEVTLPEDDVDIRTPPTLQQHLNHASIQRPISIFEDEDYDGITRFTSGRGRALRAIYRPGAEDQVNLESDDYVRKSIRKVSCLGYSNEFIEKSFGKKTHRSPSPTAHLPVEQKFCDIQEECESSKQIASPIKRNVSTSPNKQKVEEKKPPPLSVLLGRKHKPNKPEVKKKGDNGEHSRIRLNPDAPEFKSKSSSPVNGTSTPFNGKAQFHSPAKSGSDKENGLEDDRSDWRRSGNPDEFTRNFIKNNEMYFYGEHDPYRYYKYDGANEIPFNISSDEDFPAL